MLTRFDLGRDEFVIFKAALIDYLQRFVDEISRHMPQVADLLRQLEPLVPALCARAGEDQRLVGVDGSRARRATGLDPDDWEALHSWFVGSGGRRADADNVRALATDAMRSLLVNLRRIAAGADRQHSRYADLVRLAGWFDAATDDDAHALWASAFGLYSARHLGFAADDDADPVPATASWWETPPAEVPMSLRRHGERKAVGRSGTRVDYSAAKAARLGERRRQQTQRRRRSPSSPSSRARAASCGMLHVGDEARSALLDLHARARRRGPTAPAARLVGHQRGGARVRAAAPPRPARTGTGGRGDQPGGRLVFRDLALTPGRRPRIDDVPRRRQPRLEESS